MSSLQDDGYKPGNGNQTVLDRAQAGLRRLFGYRRAPPFYSEMSFLLAVSRRNEVRVRNEMIEI
jgi:hypothetical protein